MRVVLDTNVFISALIARGLTARALKLWQQNRYDLVTSTWQIGELQGVTRREHVQRYLRPGDAGTLINALQDKAVVLEALPRMDDSPDPDDNNILATAVAGGAHYLVTGDKTDLQALEKVQGVRILTVRGFMEIMDWRSLGR